MVLYVNELFLLKYRKDIPKTWDELIETSQYILEEERKLNNTEFVAYNGLLNGIHIKNYFNINKFIIYNIYNI